jgi:hypothetical protein
MSKVDAPEELRLRPRPSAPVTLSIPLDLLDSIREAAAARDMSVEALLKLHIGEGMRQDAVLRSSESLLETTAEVLARHIPSEEERAAILREIRGESAA